MANRKIKGIMIEIGGDTTKLRSSLTKVDNQLSKTQTALRDVNRLLKLDPKNTELVAQKQRLLKNAISETKEKLTTLKTAEKEAQKAFSEGKISQEHYETLKREIIETEAKLKNLEKTAAEAGNKMQAYANKTKAVGDSISNVGEKLLPISAAAGAAEIAAGKMAISFEDSMANINTLLDDTSNLEGYKNAVLELSNETGINLNIMSQGMYQTISSLGDGGEKTEAIFGKMAKSAKAGGAEVQDAVSLISAGMKGYNSVNEETAQKISDLAFQTAKLGVTTFPEMARSMQPLFPLSSSLNLSYEELFGTMATLTGVTGNTSEVSTQLKAVFSNLLKPTAQMSELMSKYGYESGSAMIQSEGLQGVLKILQKETGGEASKLAELFSSTEALTAVTALTGPQMDVFGEKLAAMGDAAGATDAAYDKLSTNGDKIRKSFNKAKNTATEFGLVLMDVLAPVLDSISNGISKLQSWFSGLSEEQQKMIVIIGLIVAAIGPALTITGKVISTVGVVMGAIGKLKILLAGIPSIAGAAGSGLALFSGPLLPIIGIISGVVAAGVLLYKNWDAIKEKATELGLWISEKWENIKVATSEKWESVKSTISEKWEGIKTGASSAVENVKTVTSNGWENVKTKTSEAWSMVKSSIEAHGGGIQGVIGTYVEGYKKIWGFGFSAINQMTGGRLGEALNTVQNKMSAVKNEFSDKIEGAKSVVRNGIEKIKSFFNFSWSLPHLKLPHFNISGKFSLKPPSVPHFSVQWYKKAMDKAYILNSASIFGSMNGKLLGGGETGSEMVVGTQHMMNMIQQATSLNNMALITAINSGIDRVVGMMQQYYPQFGNAEITIDGKKVIGWFVPKIDKALGQKAKLKMIGVE